MIFPVLSVQDAIIPEDLNLQFSGFDHPRKSIQFIINLLSLIHGQ